MQMGDFLRRSFFQGPSLAGTCSSSDGKKVGVFNGEEISNLQNFTQVSKKLTSSPLHGSKEVNFIPPNFEGLTDEERRGEGDGSHGREEGAKRERIFLSGWDSFMGLLQTANPVWHPSGGSPSETP